MSDISSERQTTIAVKLNQAELNLLILTVARHVDFVMNEKGRMPSGLLAGLSLKLSEALDDLSDSPF